MIKIRPRDERVCKQWVRKSKRNYQINEKIIKIFLLPKDQADSKNAIIEIRAYRRSRGKLICVRFIQNVWKSMSKNWNIEIISISKSDAGGLKEVIALIKGKIFIPH